MHSRQDRVSGGGWSRARARARYIYVAVACLVLAALPTFGADTNQRSHAPYGYMSLGANSGIVDTGLIYLHGCLGVSGNGGTIYIQFFDRTTVPGAGVAPSMAPIAVAGAIPFAWDSASAVSRVFLNGVVWAESSTRDTYTAVAGTDISISCQYN